MLEFIGSGILGSLFGGLFRLAPELLKLMDKKDERKHELSMMDKQLEFEKLKGSIKLEEKYADFSTQELQVIQKAFEEQSSTASNSYKWVAALSALVRPMVTYVLFGMYVAFKAAMMSYAFSSGVPWVTVMQQAWSPDDFAMLNATLTFWFISRSIERYSK